ncbi:META domain-containing protein [Parendozoicomonas haliclonae]|uniref:Heat-inducible protein n=1 Tax=Parendozoicomonas haliclonae TaxID=1960125 RepID=A0A1X7AHN8_9GAMM|nr:META domain-containing protein [Parendozoicomonas haliclonae]SMA43321.1 heat-inducible protein [Parendozoicomonas haliclonae]
MKKLTRIALALTAGSMVAACASVQSTPVSPASLEGRTWVLESVDGEGPVYGKRIVMTFQPESSTSGKMYGLGPCNRFFGGYTLANNGTTINFGTVGNTMMACEPKVMDQELKFMAAFVPTHNISLHGDQLVMTSEDKSKSLTFLPESSQIKGKLSFKGELPAGSEIVVRLEDSSLMDVAAITIAEEAIKLDKATSSPVSFDMNYAPHLLTQSHTYTVRAEVISQGMLIYTTTTRNLADFDKPMTVNLDKQ